MELNMFSDIAKFCQSPPPKKSLFSIKNRSPLDWRFGWILDWKVMVVLAWIFILISIPFMDIPILRNIIWGIWIIFFVSLSRLHSKSRRLNKVQTSFPIRRFSVGGGGLSAARVYDTSYSPGIMAGSTGPFPMSRRKERKRRDTYRG